MLLHLICSVKVIHVLVNEFATVLLIAPAATHPLHVSRVWFCVRRAVLRLLRLGFTPSKSCDSHLKTHSEITLNITGRKICMSQQNSSTHLLRLSLSTPPCPFHSFSSPIPPHPFSLILASLFVPLFFYHFLLLLLPPFLWLCTLFLCLSPPLSPARLLIPPLHPNLNSLKPSIRLHNKLLPLQARQGSCLPVAFWHCVPPCLCACVFSVY